jgi:REP element-mobilizing transposase RayT
MAYQRPRFMARKLRIQYPGAIYHVMNRGDHQERIFCGDEDRKGFLATLAEGCGKTGWQIHSYCLMTNHLHQLASRRKGHSFKVELAAKLRAETTVSVSWMAPRLAMGTRGHLAHLLYLKGQTCAEPQQSNQPSLNM